MAMNATIESQIQADQAMDAGKRLVWLERICGGHYLHPVVNGRIEAALGWVMHKDHKMMPSHVIEQMVFGREYWMVSYQSSGYFKCPNAAMDCAERAGEDYFERDSLPLDSQSTLPPPL